MDVVASTSQVNETDEANELSHEIHKATDYGPNDSKTRKKLRHFFHSNTFHVLLTVLIVLDLSIVLTDIVLLLIYCDDIPHGIEIVIEDLVIISIIILGIFLIELSLQIFAFGVKEWFQNCLHVFDLIVTLLTFIMEIAFHNNSKVESVVSLLIVFRLWRLVRVIHITTEAVELKHETEQIEHQHKDEELLKRYNQLQQENEQLKDELNKYKQNGNKEV